jgi:hypothetical protein
LGDATEVLHAGDYLEEHGGNFQHLGQKNS